MTLSFESLNQTLHHSLVGRCQSGQRLMLKLRSALGEVCKMKISRVGPFP